MEREKKPNKLPPYVPVDEKDKRLVRVKERVRELECCSFNKLPPYVCADEKDSRSIRVKEPTRRISHQKKTEKNGGK